jgi:hypothetical protein
LGNGRGTKQKGAHEMGEQKENVPPTDPLMGPGTLVPTSVGQVFDFLITIDYSNYFRKHERTVVFIQERT